MKEYKLYNGLVKILFNENQHSYWLEEDGKKKRLCGVTTYINILDKPALIPWAVKTTIEFLRKNLDQLQEDPSLLLRQAREEASRQKDIAAEIGTAIHKWISDHINGENPEMPEDERVQRGVISFIDWITENKVEFIASERVLYSMKYRYSGIADLIIKIGDKKYLADIKTGNAIYDEAKMQTAAYIAALEEEDGISYDGRIIIRISKELEEDYKKRMEEKGKTNYDPYKIFEAVYLDEDYTKDLDAFLGCIKLYKWKNNK